MIDVQEILRGAVAGAPSSLVDDPTAWSEPLGPTTREHVSLTLSAVVVENATSALASAFGKQAERIGTTMDAAIVEDGPLADLAEIWGAEVTGLAGVRGLPDLSAVIDASDWESRIDALRAMMARVVEIVVTPDALSAPAAAQLDRLIELDPRLAHLVAADDFTPPAFLGLDPADAPDAEITWDDAPPEGTGEPVVDWDDEPAAAAPVTGRRGRGRRNGSPVPKLSGLLEAAGFADKDVAALFGIDKSTYSLMRSGKRPWQGVRDDVAAKLRAELSGRRDAIDQAESALMDFDVRHADTPAA